MIGRFSQYLTLHLQAQIQSLLGGEIKWGLKGGKLDFVLVNCHLTPNIWKGCIRMLCSAWNTNIKLKVPEIPKGIPSEKEP